MAFDAFETLDDLYNLYLKGTLKEDRLIEYLLKGPWEYDIQRFSLFADKLKKLLGETYNKVVSIGCGSAEESLPFVKAGFTYEGYDISMGFADQNPLITRRLAQTTGTELNSAVKAEYSSYDDVPEVDYLLHLNEETLRKLQLNYGKKYDATNPELWANVDSNSIVLFRHPDVKDHYAAVNGMLRNAIQTNQPIVITTSNLMSLFLLLDLIKTLLLETGQITDMISLKGEDYLNSQIHQDYQGFIDRVGDLKPDVLAKLPEGYCYAERMVYQIAQLANYNMTFSDKSIRTVSTVNSLDISKLEHGRRLDSWQIVIQHAHVATNSPSPYPIPY